ncbi:hypothetical protein AVEN_38100-1 [Araneus ventricosus]|uniref:Uncharacterized protein n=1 Tax=Araneus ventricosus TaxID=182803 RepID=A0A4Y2G7T2_ARAVE|nr:hypothetical protein AVEN_38100-1 [Araneus ventricosus]
MMKMKFEKQVDFPQPNLPTVNLPDHESFVWLLNKHLQRSYTAERPQRFQTPYFFKESDSAAKQRLDDAQWVNTLFNTYRVLDLVNSPRIWDPINDAFSGCRINLAAAIK